MHGVILDAASLGKLGLAPLTDGLGSWDIYPHTLPVQVTSRIRDAEVVLSNKVLLDQSALKASTKLKYIGVLATGTNNVDLQAARVQQVVVSNARGYATASVAQHSLALILNLAINLPRYTRDVEQGKWQKSPVFTLLDHPITELAGKSLGIVGYGELGREVARLGSALGMKILIAARSGQNAAPPRIAFEEVVRTSDVLSLHCPLDKSNRHLIDAKVLGMMKPTALLINTARGGLVDAAALILAIESGEIGGAGIDVLDQEPPAADDRLIRASSLPNLIVTPHNAWGTLESRQRLLVQSRENLDAFLAGKPIRVVTPPD